MAKRKKLDVKTFLYLFVLLLVSPIIKRLYVLLKDTRNETKEDKETALKRFYNVSPDTITVAQATVIANSLETALSDYGLNTAFTGYDWSTIKELLDPLTQNDFKTVINKFGLRKYGSIPLLSTGGKTTNRMFSEDLNLIEWFRKELYSNFMVDHLGYLKNKFPDVWN